MPRGAVAGGEPADERHALQTVARDHRAREREMASDEVLLALRTLQGMREEILPTFHRLATGQSDQSLYWMGRFHRITDQRD